MSSKLTNFVQMNNKTAENLGWNCYKNAFTFYCMENFSSWIVCRVFWNTLPYK